MISQAELDRFYEGLVTDVRDRGIELPGIVWCLGDWTRANVAPTIAFDISQGASGSRTLEIDSGIHQEPAPLAY